MRGTLFALGSWLFATACAASNVLELTPDNFEKHVYAGGKPALVEFFAPWCTHCKRLAPIYEELGDLFSHAKDKVVIAKVDADGVGKPLGQKYGVTSFPTLFWFDGSEAEPIKHEGPRDLESLENYITEKTGIKGLVKPKPPGATLQLDVSNFEEVVKDPKKDVLVAFTASWCGHCKAMKPSYEAASEVFKPESNCILANIEADAEKNAPLAHDYGVSSFPTFKFFSKTDKEGEAYDGGRTEEDFVKYMNEKCGTHRAVGGGLTDAAGRIAALDKLASKFYSAASDVRSSVYQEALALADAATTHGKHYIKVMEKVVNGSEEYLVKESTRLKKILDKKSLSASKLDELKIKANILASFAEQKAADVKEAVEDVASEASAKAAEATKKVKEEL